MQAARPCQRRNRELRDGVAADHSECRAQLHHPATERAAPYFTSIIRDATAFGSSPTSSLTEYFPAGTIDRSSSIDRADKTPAAPFSCQRRLSGVSFGAM